MDYNIVAIIPARHNSKGVIQKNLQKVGGSTLLERTVDSALESKHIDLVVVTTESVVIENAVDMEAKVLLRPEELSQDHVQVDEVILYTLRQLQFEGINPKTIIVLQPTSPLRTTAHIDEALELYQEWNILTKPFELPTSLISVWEPGWPHENPSEESDGLLISYELSPSTRLGRQDGGDPEVAIENGAIYIADAKRVSREKTFRFVENIPYYMDKMSSLEVDEVVDLAVAEVYLKHIKND
jgi:CMP-N-acetylneuraminic acid synthetase